MEGKGRRGELNASRLDDRERPSNTPTASLYFSTYGPTIYKPYEFARREEREQELVSTASTKERKEKGRAASAWSGEVEGGRGGARGVVGVFRDGRGGILEW